MRPTHLLALAALTLTGCHSAHIEATISNRTPDTLTLVEVDYPSASFGTQTLAPGQDFHYRFKVLGSGPTTLLYTDPTLLYTDPTLREHKDPTGPTLHESDEGTLTITIQPTGPIWDFEPLHK